MQTKNRLIVALGLSLLASAARCDDASPPPQALHLDLEVGLGHVSEDSAKFGQYNGLNKEGTYVIGNVDGEVREENGLYGSVRGTNLGLDSRYLRIDGGKQGKAEGFLEFHQLHSRNSDDAVTPFKGNDSLRLPDIWVPKSTTKDMPQLEQSLHSVDIETERKRYGGGFTLFPLKHWSFNMNYHHEHKDGTGAIGGSMSYLDAAAILPKPVDYNTDDIEATVNYTKDKGQFQLAYRMSLFSNDDKSLQWENPYSQGADKGRLALAPDNQFHQVSLSGGYRLPMHTRLTAMASVGLMRQDQSFLPFTTNSAWARPLPTSRLDGRVYITTARAQLNSRPLPKWEYNASLRFYDRNDNSSQNDYDYVTVDQFPGGTRRNHGYSYRQNQVKLRAGYRVSKRVKLSLDYRFDNTSRNQAQVDNVHDNSLKATLRFQPRGDLSASLYVAGSRRSESGNYRQQSRTTNSDLRAFYLAKRKQGKAGLAIDYMPTTWLDLSASADYVHDLYNDTRVGLRSSTHPTYNLSVSYTPVAHITAYSFYTYDGNDTKQRGSESGDGRDWSANTEDRTNTYGLGIQWDSILNKFDIGADYVYNQAKGKTDLHANGDYPNVRNRLKTIKLYTRYHMKKDLDIKLSYEHSNYNSDNWANDGVTPNTIDEVISLGQDSPNYSVDVFGLSMIYRMF